MNSISIIDLAMQVSLEIFQNTTTPPITKNVSTCIICIIRVRDSVCIRVTLEYCQISCTIQSIINHILKVFQDFDYSFPILLIQITGIPTQFVHRVGYIWSSTVHKIYETAYNLGILKLLYTLFEILLEIRYHYPYQIY